MFWKNGENPGSPLCHIHCPYDMNVDIGETTSIPEGCKGSSVRRGESGFQWNKMGKKKLRQKLQKRMLMISCSFPQGICEDFRNWRRVELGIRKGKIEPYGDQSLRSIDPVKSGLQAKLHIAHSQGQNNYLIQPLRHFVLIVCLSSQSQIP